MDSEATGGVFSTAEMELDALEVYYVLPEWQAVAARPNLSNNIAFYLYKMITRPSINKFIRLTHSMLEPF